MLDVLPPPPDICPVANPCNIRIEFGPPCGESQIYFPPELLAEQLCPWAIAGAIQREKERSVEATQKYRGRALTGKEFRLGSLHFEMALALPTALPPESAAAEELQAAKAAQLAAAEEHLSYAAARLGHVAGIRAAFLKTYLHQSHLRNFQIVPIENVRAVQNGVLDIVDATKTGRHREEVEEQAGIHLLYARQRKLAFPVTAREVGFTGNATQFALPLSHQLYTFDPSGRRKIPHRLKPVESRTNAMGLLFTRFGRTAKEAFDKVAPNTVDTTKEASEWAFDVLYNEVAEGTALAPTDKRVIEEMQNIIDRKRREFIRRTGPENDL